MEQVSSKNYRVRNYHSRDNRGAAVIGLCLVLSLFMIFIIFFAFDMNRLQMAQRQLTAICDAAALAGTAMLTSKDTAYENSNLDILYTTQLAAEQYAKNMVALGNILGSQCYDSAASTAIPGGIPLNYVTSSSALNTPTPGTLNVWVQLCSPINNYQIVAPGNSSARAIYIQAAYGYIPFLRMLGIPSVTLPTTSTSSLQKLYVIMVFDCSGSMDDNTVVSFVYRRWSESTDGTAIDNANGGKGQYVYNVVGSPGSGTGAGQLWQYSGLDYSAAQNGTALNVLPPQNLDFIGIIFANNYSGSFANASSVFTNGLAYDMAIAHYVPWMAGVNLGAATYNQTYTTYPIIPGTPNFQGPYYDNYYGTPPGNCRVKYGPCAAGSSYGGNLAANTASATKVMNIWDGVSTTQRPGPGTSPGYYYYPNGYGNTSAGAGVSGQGDDSNSYFYDPYSMPKQNTNTTYTAFTDLVANITAITPPVTQPYYGPTPFASFTQTFPSGSSDQYQIAVAETASQNFTFAGVYEWNSTLANIRTYKFSSIAYVVEAARGNLDLEWNSSGSYINSTQTNFDNALLAYGSNLGTGNTPVRADVKAGYQMAYQRLAMYVMQPYATAVDGAMRFFQNLCQSSCCNFGLVGFSVMPAVTAGYNCSYVYSSGFWSLGLKSPANTTKPTAVYSSYIYEPPQLYGSNRINPNFWVTVPAASVTNGSIVPSGPAGGSSSTGTGAAYHSSLNTNGPLRTTWLAVNGGSAPSNDNTLWAFNNCGFLIPRAGCAGATSQQQAYYNVAGDDWFGISFSNPKQYGGMNGIQHALPLYDTAGLEALKAAVYNLTNISSLNALAGVSTGLTSLSNYGTKKAIVFFTDGVPTDDTSASFDSYQSQVVTPAQSNGVAIYAIGLALNDSIKLEQYNFLNTLANKGACGSQQYQITSNGSLTSTFTGIARQLAQCQR
jgi:Flp pilus assembly protein TadG